MIRVFIGTIHPADYGLYEPLTAFDVERETAEKMQGCYNFNQFVTLCKEEGRLMMGKVDSDDAILLDGAADTDGITAFLDDLATALAE